MTDDKDPHAELKKNRLTPELQKLIDNARKVPREPKKLQKRKQHFVMVPWAWVERLKGATVQTHRVALHLLYLHWRHKGPFKLPNGMLKIDGITRYSKWRALADLEQRGLIVVERRRRKSPRVSVLINHAADLRHDP
jgi:hypothetical protein